MITKTDLSLSVNLVITLHFDFIYIYWQTACKYYFLHIPVSNAEKVETAIKMLHYLAVKQEPHISYWKTSTSSRIYNY